MCVYCPHAWVHTSFKCHFTHTLLNKYLKSAQSCCSRPSRGDLWPSEFPSMLQKSHSAHGGHVQQRCRHHKHKHSFFLPPFSLFFLTFLSFTADPSAMWLCHADFSISAVAMARQTILGSGGSRARMKSLSARAGNCNCKERYNKSPSQTTPPPSTPLFFTSSLPSSHIDCSGPHQFTLQQSSCHE